MNMPRIRELAREVAALARRDELTYESWARIYSEADEAAGPRPEALEAFEKYADPEWVKRYNREN